MLRKLLSLLVAGGWLALAACAGAGQGTPGAAAQPAYPYEAGAVTVSAAENFYADMLHSLGGPQLKIYSFISDPNADPHEFEAAPGNARAVADSRLVIENGLGYDAFMDRLLQASPNPTRQVINVQHLVGAPQGANAHLWYDPTVMPRLATATDDALVSADSANAETYRANLAAYLASLSPIAERVAALRSRVKGLPIAFTEPVWGYMAHALGLEVRSPAEFMKAIEEGNDPPAGAVAAEQDLITRHEVKVLIYNSQTVTKITTQVKDLATRNNLPVVGVSETQPPGLGFAEWQLAELDQVAAALGVT